LERATHAFGGSRRGHPEARWFELGWITRLRDTRALLITDRGKCGFAETFGIEPAA